MPIKLAEIRITYWKTVWQFLKRFSIELPHDPAVSIPGYVPKRVGKHTYPQKLYLNVHENLIHHSQKWMQPPCFHQVMNEKQNVIYSYN